MIPVVAAERYRRMRRRLIALVVFLALAAGVAGAAWWRSHHAHATLMMPFRVGSSSR